MRKLLVAGVAAAALCSAPALAADYPVKAGPAPAVFNWTGFYFGGHAGYSWGHLKSDLLDDGDPTEDIGVNKWHGLVYGSQFGYNSQINNLVVGIEGDWSGAIGNKSASAFDAGDPFADSVAAKLTDLASVRGRVGILMSPNSLLYATGGWGWGRARIAASDSDNGVAGGNRILHVNDSGAVYGGGWEYMLSPISTVRIEYLHYAFSRTNTVLLVDSPVTNTLRGIDVVRLGVNFKFGDLWGKGPVSAKY